MAQTVIGIFKDADRAQQAVDQLLSNGFKESNVDLSSNVQENRYFDDNSESVDRVERDTDEWSTGSRPERDRDNGHHHESGIARFFRNLFGNDNDSEKYTKVAENGCVVTVHALDDEEAKLASEILDDNDAVDVDEQYKQYNNSEFDKNIRADEFRPAANRDVIADGPNANSDYHSSDIGNLPNNEGRTIPIIEENLVVGKREIETGGVRIRSRIVEKPVEETLRLREEKIRVERNAVDRDAHPSDIDNFREGTVELRERKEVPEVSKETRVVEEISLDRDVEHHEETIRDTVRHTEVDVEDLKDKSQRDRSDL